MPGSKVAILGMVITPSIGNQFNRYINLYGLGLMTIPYGKTGSLDPSTYNFFPYKNPDPIRSRIDVLNIFFRQKTNPGETTKTCTFSPSSSTAAAKVATFLPTNKTQTSQNTGGNWEDVSSHKVGPKNQLYVGLSPWPRIPGTTRIIIFLGSGIPT